MIEKLKFKPRDLQKPNNHENKTFALDPWGARESENKPRFDPVKVGKCDHLHTITKVGCFFFIDFWETLIFRKRSAQIRNRAKQSVWIPRVSLKVFNFEILSFQKRRKSKRFQKIKISKNVYFGVYINIYIYILYIYIYI